MDFKAQSFTNSFQGAMTILSLWYAKYWAKTLLPFLKRTPPYGKIWENDFIKSYLEEVVNSSKKFQTKIKWTIVNLSKNCTWKTLHWYCFHAWKCFLKQEIFATGLTFLVEASLRGKRKKAWKCSWKWNTCLSLHCHQFRKMLWEKGRLLF